MTDSFDELCEQLQVLKKIEFNEFGITLINGIPERWMDYPGPKYRCPNGHVSKTILRRSEGPRDACLECFEAVRMTFPEDQDGPLISSELFRRNRTLQITEFRVENETDSDKS